MNTNIVLIGYRCSGKTAVGKKLAKEMGKDFIDTDLLIEKSAGCSIEDMISRHGWDHFRGIEKRIIKEVSHNDHQVIATGGGVVMDDDNVKNLKRNGFVIWLKGDADVLKERMIEDQRSGNTRPSLTGDDPMDEIKKVLDIRNPFYRQAGDVIVDTSALSIQEVADRIIQESTIKMNNL